ncbi:MAG TPA: 4Fe-4S dicluster domain-containing protein [Terriglobales bacterium]|nr:4Fe-4S dicluster domain-containing protein [Terriglobales bacterium]
MGKAILYDATLCIGCKACEQACSEQNHLPYNETIAAEEATSEHKFTSVLTRGENYLRRMCMHCEDPTCASVCPVGALRKTELGPVTYEESRCIGCRYCMVACPFSAPKYEWGKVLPGVRKCTMCAQRVAAGQATACAEACPTGATKFGDRDELIAEARQRLAQNPTQYVNHIFGLSEVGGTSVLMISGVPFERFGMRSNYVQEPLPLLTYRVLSRIPDLVTLGSVLLGGVWWITHRRAEVAAAEGNATKPGEKEPETEKNP